MTSAAAGLGSSKASKELQSALQDDIERQVQCLPWSGRLRSAIAF